MMDKSGSNKLLKAYLLGILAVIGFGGTLPVTKIALADFSPEFITFARSLIAAILAITLLGIFRKRLHHPNNPEIFLAGLLLVFGFPGLMAFAMQTVPASHGGVVLGFLPLTTAIIARMITDEKPSPFYSGFSAYLGALLLSFIPTSKQMKLDKQGYRWAIFI